MFSSKKYLDKRTPENGIDRKEFIQLLADEYRTTTSADAKLQVTANLANFAYDPINFEYLRSAKVLEIFLELLNCGNESLIIHGLAGICNICVEAESRQYILASKGFDLICKLLITTKHPEIILNSITTLIFLLRAEKDSLKVNSEVIQVVNSLKESPDLRIRKLATLFLADYCQNAGD